MVYTYIYIYIVMEYTYIVRYADKTYNVAKVNGQIEIQHAEVSAGYICTCNDKSISMRFLETQLQITICIVIYVGG